VNNKALLAALIVGAILLLVLGVVVLIALLPVLGKAFGYVMANGVPGVVKEVLSITKLLGLGGD